MKRSAWLRIIAVILIISMVAAPVSAAGAKGSTGTRNHLIGNIADMIRDLFRDRFGGSFGQPGEEPTTPSNPVDPTTPTEPGETEPEESEPEISLELIEGHANTLNGHLLRGVTYSLTEVLAAQSNPPFSLRNNGFGATSLGGNTAGSLSLGRTPLNAMAETETTISDTALEITYDDAGNAVIDNGDYVLCFDGGKYLTNVEGSTNWGTTLTSTATKDAATIWTITRQDDGTYTIQDPNDKYFAVLAHNDAAMSDTVIYMAIQRRESDTNNTVIKQLNTTAEKCFVNALGGLNTGAVGGWSAGTPMKFYAVTVAEIVPPEEPDTIDPADDSRDIPTEVMTATAENFQPNNNSEGNPSYAIDKNENTLWHTVHQDSERDTHWIQFTLSESYTVDGLRYLPRQTGTNGTITEYQVLVSNDGETWTEVATGTWAGDSNWKIAQFEGKDVKYVRLKAVNAMSGDNRKFAAAAEIRLTGVKNAESEEPATGPNLVYFPVTMFNYNQDVLRPLTNQAEVEAGLKELWEGLYFSGGTPASTSYTYTASAAPHADLTWQQVMNGTYYVDDACTSQAVVTEIIEGSGDYQATTVSVGDIWTAFGGNTDGTWYPTTYKHLYRGTYYTVAIQRPAGVDYFLLGYQGNASMPDFYYQIGYFNASDNAELYTVGGTVTGYNLVAGGQTLATLNGTNTAEQIGVTLYTAGGTKTVNKFYSRWNWWAYREHKDGSTDAQNMFYTGLVQDELVNGELKLTVPDPGIFTFDADHPEVTNDGVKDIYQNVGLPFVKNDKGYYTFDSDTHGTYFADTTGDGNSDPWYGASDDYFNMFFDYQNTQGWDGMYYGDGSTNLWAPFNTNENDTGEGAIDYHLGMRADIPFSMTSNGCIKSTDDNSEHITFTFAGDDDVWIFIDGHLVIDLGGIHNRIGATIDFAANTITYFRPKSNAKTLPIGSFNDPENYPLNADGTITVKLYNDTNGEGALGQTRTDFASDEEHEMSIFYLERGMGTSNCKIEFNLPMRDTVLITKDATKSWSEAKDKEDEDGDGTDYLTTKEQAAVDKLNFGFTLYKKTADETAFTAVTNTNFFVQDKTGKVIATSSTDGNGKFYLKNGQTAKFMTDIPREGITYYVVEDAVPAGFLTPDYKYAGAATWGYDYIGEAIRKDENGDYILDAEGNLTSGIVRGTATNAAEIGEHELPMDATENKSYEVTVKGSVESIDSIEFICTNYLDAELPNPSALANEDIIVIDYGLPVQIDPLANDLFRGDNIEIVAWGDESLTLNEVKDESGNAIPHGTEGGTSWTGNKFFSNTTTEAQVFDSGNVTFNDVTYAEHAHEITNDDGTKTTTYTYTRDSFEYELTKQLTEVEVIHYIIKVTSTETQDGTGLDNTACRYSLAKVYIVPATIMYYEENFSNMISFEGAGWDDESTESNQSNVSDFQEPGVVGTVGDSTYGSDVAYLSDDGDSNGTYRFGDTTNGAIRFTYTFTGTGSSIFARTSANTGYMQVKLYRGTEITDEALENITYRDTYWKDENGSELDNAGTLYNIPVYSTNENLDYDTYTVVCTIAKKGTITAGNDYGAGNEFYLDGIRVLRPLDIVIEQDGEWDDEGNLIQPIVYDELTTKALGAYADDGETNLDVVTLRQKLITDYDYLLPEEDENGEVVGEKEQNWPFAVLTDIEGEIVLASDYISIGPKEEVYLSKDPNASNGQKVSFSLKYWEPEGLKLYMGMKAPFGGARVNIGHNVYELKNAPDCYYDVTDNYASLVTETDEDGYEYYVVTYTFEAAENIVSLTNIKVVGQHEFVIVEKTDIDMP